MLEVVPGEPEDWRAARALRRVIASGEALPRGAGGALAERLRGVELHNLYGPTEAAVDVTCVGVPAGTPAERVPIGRPIANTQMYVLDGHGEPVPVGAPASCTSAASGWRAGIWNRPELTAERFVPDPFGGEPGARLYRTGDLARLACGRRRSSSWGGWTTR